MDEKGGGSNRVSSPSDRGSSLLSGNMPDLRPEPSTMTYESSYLESPSIDNRHADAQAERAVLEHLAEMEASLASPFSPLNSSQNTNHDTFIYDSPTKKPTKRASIVVPTNDDSDNDVTNTEVRLPVLPFFCATG